MDKRTINIVIGVVLALLAIMMIQRFIGEQQAELKRLKSEGELMEVVIAKRDLPRETTITVDMVGRKTVNRNSFQPGDLTDSQSAIGKFTEVDVLKGQHINSNMVRSLGAIRFLSQGVPQGYRAITIPVDKISAIEGLIKPGDKIDMIATFNLPGPMGQSELVVMTIFQGVKVLATNRNLSPYQVSKAINTITLALKPADIKVLTYVLETSRIRLVLRPPLDASEEFGYAAVTFQALMQKLGMWQPQPQEFRQETVEVYRATTVEDAPINR